MPHSAGGGSSGGGSHYGGSSGSGTTYSNRPFAGATHYVYYHNGMPKHYYATSKIPEFTFKNLIFGLIVTFVFMLFVPLMFIFSDVHPKKIDIGPNPNIVIEDNLNVLTKKDEIRNLLEEYQENLGVTVGIVTLYNDDWQNHYSELTDYAYDKYISLFSGDETHFLLVYSTSNIFDNNAPRFYEYMQGDDTDSILHEGYTKKLIDLTYEKLINEKRSLDDTILEVFSTYDLALEPYREVGLIVCGIVFSVILVGVGVALISSYKMYKGRGNAYAVTNEEILIKCEYCDSTFPKGDIKQCPNCGATIIEDIE